MWIILGHRTNSERVPYGKTAERTCERCKEYTLFYECEVSSTVRLYLIDMFDYNTHRVMACSACGAQFATDDFSARVGQQLSSAFERAGETASGVLGSVSERLKPAAEKASATVERLSGELRSGAYRDDTHKPSSEMWVLPSFDSDDEPPPPPPRRTPMRQAPRFTPKPVDQDTAKLLRRFEELERRDREKKERDE